MKPIRLLYVQKTRRLTLMFSMGSEKDVLLGRMNVLSEVKGYERLHSKKCWFKKKKQVGLKSVFNPEVELNVCPTC